MKCLCYVADGSSDTFERLSYKLETHHLFQSLDRYAFRCRRYVHHHTPKDALRILTRETGKQYSCIQIHSQSDLMSETVLVQASAPETLVGKLKNLWTPRSGLSIEVFSLDLGIFS